VAVGFSMIFGVGRVLNLAHGALVLFGAYVAIWLHARGDPTIRLPQPGLGLPWVLLGAVLATTLLSVLIYLLLVRRIQEKPVAVFMTTLLLAIMMEVVIEWGFTSNPRALPPLVEGEFPLFAISLPYNRLVTSGITLAVIALLWFFINRTKLGMAILATSMAPRGAALIGVDVHRIRLVTWAISGALAAIAGVFLASFLGTSPVGGRFPLIISFTIVILGGMGSIQGSLLAAYLVGYLETATTYLLSPTFRGFPSLIILVLVLLFRPQGLLGRQ